MTATVTPNASSPTASRRRRGIVIALGVVVALLALAVAYLLGAQRPNTTPPAATPPPAASCPDWPDCDGPASSSPVQQQSLTPTTVEVTTPAPAAGGLANGCLGGPNPFAAILTARSTATPDIAGAAALARTYGRWMVTYPIDPQATQAMASVVGADSGSFLTNTIDSLNQLARQLQSGGYTEGKALPDEAMYRFEPGTTDDYVLLDQVVSRQLTRSDGRVETTKIAMTLVLERDANGWAITDAPAALVSDPFAPSTAAPWMYYEGVC